MVAQPDQQVAAKVQAVHNLETEIAIGLASRLSADAKKRLKAVAEGTSCKADAARRAGAQEALLFDGEERLVEGARTNVIVASERGDLLTPPLARGGVAGIARAIALERVPELREGDVAAEDLFGAREVVVVNAVRGARSIATLDGRPIGDPQRPLHAQLAEALERG